MRRWSRYAQAQIKVHNDSDDASDHVSKWNRKYHKVLKSEAGDASNAFKKFFGFQNPIRMYREAYPSIIRRLICANKTPPTKPFAQDGISSVFFLPPPFEAGVAPDRCASLRENISESLSRSIPDALKLAN